jgi:hypothetical protein
MIPEMKQSKDKQNKGVGISPAILFVPLSLSISLLAQAASNACTGKKVPRFEDYPAAAAYEGKARVPILATALDRTGDSNLVSKHWAL